jgi:hypothetical protein
MATTLHHVSGWQALATVQVGDLFTLMPGAQNAEGVGVYFSEEHARLSAAEGAHMQPTAVISIEVVTAVGWWQSKASKARKFAKPRTWHSNGKSICCRVVAISEAHLASVQVRVLHCSWKWK